VREFRQFLVYARGSAQETITHLRIAGAVDPAHHRAIRELENRVVVISKMISRLHAHPPPDHVSS
jgi:four helix bundle protein